jgi:phosphomannomutase
MHGAGAGVLDLGLARAGVRVERLRGEPDPGFGGAAPDPVPARLSLLARRVRRGSGLRLGLATDGDADRYGVVDADGRVLSETEALALLVDHLARTGRVHRGVALSVATGSLVERVAAAHGLPVTRHPIGFKHLAAALASGQADVAGEESAGFAWSPFCRDKDGILAGCLFAEIVAHTRAPLGRRLRELVRAHGASCCARVALRGAPGPTRALEALRVRPPERVAGARVLAATSEDGLRLTLRDGFVMLRCSGTEPVVRIYAEAPDARGLERRLRAGARLLGFMDGARARG